jgi:hypothetical protein
VNFICETGTVLHVKGVHSGLTNPIAVQVILPLNPQANDDWNAKQYDSFFRENMINLLNDFPTLEIDDVICDNLPRKSPVFVGSWNRIHSGLRFGIFPVQTRWFTGFSSTP